MDQHLQRASNMIYNPLLGFACAESYQNLDICPKGYYLGLQKFSYIWILHTTNLQVVSISIDRI